MRTKRFRSTVVIVLSLVLVAIAAPSGASAFSGPGPGVGAIVKKARYRAAVKLYDARWTQVKMTWEELLTYNLSLIDVCNVAEQETDPFAQGAEWVQVAKLANAARKRWKDLFDGNDKTLRDLGEKMQDGADDALSPRGSIKVAKAVHLLERAVGRLFAGTLNGSSADSEIAGKRCSEGLDRTVAAGEKFGEAQALKKRAFNLLAAAR